MCATLAVVALVPWMLCVQGVGQAAGPRTTRSAPEPEQAAPYQPKSRRGSAPPSRSSSTRRGRCGTTAPGDSRPKYVVAQEALEAMLDATDAFVAKRPDFPDQDRRLQLFEQRAHAAADPAVRSRGDPRGAREPAAARAAARRSAKRCARRGPISTAPACSASTCSSSPTARTRAAAAPTRWRARSGGKSEGARAGLLRRVRHQPGEVRVPEGRRRRRHRRRHRRGAAHGARRHLSGQDPRRGGRRGEREPAKK